jgi:hypothetical protein
MAGGEPFIVQDHIDLPLSCAISGNGLRSGRLVRIVHRIGLVLGGALY